MSISTLVIDDGSPASPNDKKDETLQILDPHELLKNASIVGFSPAAVSQSLQNTQIAGSPWGDIDSNKKFLGVDPEKLSRQRCYLIMLVLDDSGSMEGFESSTLEAANTFIKEYSDARKSEKIHSDVLVAVGTLNGGLIIPYTDVRHYVSTDLNGYKASGGTPLFDVTNSALSLQMAKTTELALNGITSKTITVLMTDGIDLGSRLDSSSLRQVVEGLNNDGRSNHIVAGIYIGNSNRQVFRDIGLKDEWILSSAQNSANLIDTFSRLSKLSMASFTQAKPGEGPTTLS